MNKKAAIHNLGCKVNAYEAEAMQQLLEAAGYEIVPFDKGADVYVINTCSVTNIADRKSRQMLHKAKKMNPEAVVVAAGCYAQTDTENLKADLSVDLILGNNRKQNIVEALEDYYKEHHQTTDVISIGKTREFEELAITKTAEHVRAYIKVQDGCNQFCTYCIIPYARGRVRSRRINDVLQEVKTLADSGYQEVVLTGIHLSSYGIDFPKEEKETLQSLILEVSRIPGIRRIRLGSLEPRVITKEFVDAISALPNFCPHFHLSLQSGCDETLARMNRHYDAKEFMEKCELLREGFENPALTTDIIVGFPQESEEEFEKSYEFVKNVDFYETHIFQYSRRQGTKAAVMEGQVPEPVKKKRSEQMIALNEERQTAYEESFLGKELEVLLEEKISVDGTEWMVGHTKEYLRVVVEPEDGIGVNSIVTAEIAERMKGHLLRGIRK